MGPEHPVIKLCSKLLFALVRAILSLRYKVRIIGFVHLKGGGKLIMPNHQAIIDPVILMSRIYKYSRAVPVLTSSYYDMPGLKIMFKTWGAVRVSDLQAGSRNVNVLKDILNPVLEGFAAGKNIVVYPSGQTTTDGKEVILNKKSAYSIVNAMPQETRVIGVRIRGLWGSIWSKAWTGKSPNLLNVIFKGVFYTLANLIFFMPRRKVLIELEDITELCREAAKHDRNYFNHALEGFYNKHGAEGVLFLKYFFLAPRLKRNLPVSRRRIAS